MSLETIRLLRNILLRGFVIGYVINALSFWLMMANWDGWMGLLSGMLHSPPAILGPIIVGYVSLMKALLLTGFLIPGLALHWTLKSELKKA